MAGNTSGGSNIADATTTSQPSTTTSAAAATTTTTTNPKEEWKSLAPMTTIRRAACGILIHDHQLLVIGGMDDADENEEYFSSCEYYDAKKPKKWKSLPIDMPTGRISFGVAKVDNQVYVMGGFVGFTMETSNLCSNLISIDVSGNDLSTLSAANKWDKTLTPMNKPRIGCACTSHLNFIYVFGGGTNTASGGTNTAEKYDINTNKWEDLPDMPGTRTSSSVGVVGNKIYVVGGVDNNRNILATTIVFDTTKQQWETSPSVAVPDMKTKRCELSVVVVDHFVLAIGGSSDESGSALSTIEVLDTQRNSWNDAPTPMKHGRCGFVAGFSKETHKIIIAGGIVNAENPLNTVESISFEKGLLPFVNNRHKSIIGGASDTAKNLPDRLGYSVYAEAVGEVVQSIEQPTESVCVGLFAPWGSGKTFFWELIKDYLENHDNNERRALAKYHEDEWKNKKATIVARSSVLASSILCRLIFFCCYYCCNINKEDVAMILILSLPIGMPFWVILVMICFALLCLKRCCLFILYHFLRFIDTFCCGCCIYWVILYESWVIWYESENKIYPKKMNDEIISIQCTPNEGSPLLNVDEESQQHRQPQNINWSDVQNILTGKTDLYKGKDDLTCMLNIQLILLTLFQNLFKILPGWYSSLSLFVFGSGFKIDEEKIMTKYIFISFNAWVYSGTDSLWAKMLEELWTKVEKECGKYTVRKYRAMISLSSENDDDDPKTRNLKRNAAISTYVTKMLLYFLFAAICFVASVIYMNKKKEEENAGSSSPTVTPTSEEPEDSNENVFSEEILKLLPYLPSAGFFTGLVGTSIKFLAKVVPEALRSRGTRILNKARQFETHKRRDFSEETGFMGEVQQEVEYLFDFVRNHHVDDNGIKMKRPIRLALFVDDLDRCPKNTIMKVLESVILLLADSPITCYLAIDTRLVVASIDEYYGSIFTNTGLDGYKFLEKIIQIPFSLPDVETVHKENFLMKLLEGKEISSPLRVYKRVKYLKKNATDIHFFSQLALKQLTNGETDAEYIRVLIEVLRFMIEEDELFFKEGSTKIDAKTLLDDVEKSVSKVYSGSDRKRELLQDKFLHLISINIEKLLRQNRTTIEKFLKQNRATADHNEPAAEKPAVTEDPVIEDPIAEQPVDVDGSPTVTVAETAVAATEATDTPINEIYTKYETYERLFNPLATGIEFEWFQKYSKYFVGSPRKMKRIANSYIIARLVALKLSPKKDNDILIFQEKLLQFTILLEQWPCRMSWMLLVVEKFWQELSRGYESPEIGESFTFIFKNLLNNNDTGDTDESNYPLVKIYRRIVKILIHSSNDSENQLLRDGDPRVFEEILANCEKGNIRLAVNDILPLERCKYSLKHFAFGLPRHMIREASNQMDKLVLFVGKESSCLSYVKKSLLFDVSNNHIDLLNTVAKLKRERQQEEAKLSPAATPVATPTQTPKPAAAAKPAATATSTPTPTPTPTATPTPTLALI